MRGRGSGSGSVLVGDGAEGGCFEGIGSRNGMGVGWDGMGWDGMGWDGMVGRADMRWEGGDFGVGYVGGGVEMWCLGLNLLGKGKGGDGVAWMESGGEGFDADHNQVQ